MDQAYNLSWLSPEMGVRASRIRISAGELFNDTPADQCEHGEQHCWAIEYAIHRLIPGGKFELLNEKERFFLLTSPWIMNIAWNQPKRLSDDDYHTKASQLLNVQGNRQALGISGVEVSIFESIIHYHNFNKSLEECPPTFSDGPEAIRVPLLTAYLRLADAIHVDDTIKGPKSLFYFLEDPDSPELFHWFKSKLRLSIQPDPGTDSIHVYVNSSIPSTEPLIQRVQEELELHVDAVRNTLVRGGLTNYLHVNVASLGGPGLSDEMKREVDRLLKEYALSFPPNAGVLQELYISSIQRIVQQTNITADTMTNEINQIQTIAEEAHRFRPCHIAFGRLIEEVNERLKQNDSDTSKVKALDRWAEDAQNARNARLNKVSEHGGSQLPSFDHFLLFGSSKTIIETMRKTFRNNSVRHKIQIYVCEAHNKSRFDLIGKLMYVDGMNYARELKTALPEAIVTLIPDVTVADVLKLKRDEGRWVALFGSNGITSEARCGHTGGHLALAIIVKHFEIPVCIICDSYKMGELETSPELERREQWIKTVPYCRSGVPEEIQLKNLRESVIEPDLISMIITEHGVFSVPQFIDRYSSRP